MSETNTSSPLSNKWVTLAPWFITIASTFALIAIGFFLIINIEWFKNSIFSCDIPERNTGAYRMRAYDIHLSMIKRSVGLFSGFAIMFIGLGISFFTLRKNTNLELKSEIWSANLATASPGLFAILVGGFLIVSTIQSKDQFGGYQSGIPSNGKINLNDIQRPTDTTGINWNKK
jgi:hypothetical protein